MSHSQEQLPKLTANDKKRTKRRPLAEHPAPELEDSLMDTAVLGPGILDIDMAAAVGSAVLEEALQEAGALPTSGNGVPDFVKKLYRQGLNSFPCSFIYPLLVTVNLNCLASLCCL